MSDNPHNIEVLVLAAGLGTRMRPLTDDTPKPLLKVGDTTLIERTFSQLTNAGFRSVWVNTHHLADKIRSFVGDGGRFGLSVNYSYEPLLLDTGGAVANIPALRNAKLVLVLNADALFLDPIPFNTIIETQNRSSDVGATLLLMEHPEAEKYGIIEAASDGQITSFIGYKTSSTEKSAGKYLFTGCSLIGRSLLSRLQSPKSVFSLTRDLMLGGIQAGLNLNAVLYGGRWIDVGTPQRLDEAAKLLATV